MKPAGSRALLIFYILIGYVALQLAWWTWMILDLQRTVFTDPVQHRAKLLMVLGELAVFLILLVIAIWQLRKSFKKELALNRRQRNFLMSVTHELRSPLAATRLNVQTMLKHDLQKEKQHDLLQRTLSETNRLDELVENILISTSLEEGGFQPHNETVDLSQFCLELLQELKSPLAAQHNLQAEIEPEVVFGTDVAAFRSIVTNLVANAVKYSSKGTSILVYLKRHEQGIVLQVSDQGIGIHKSSVHRVFEKFYREGNEEVRRTKGTGLGLFIVKELVKLTGGRISVYQNTPQGTTFEVIWNGYEK
jgi:signal transduction histidine kinase